MMPQLNYSCPIKNDTQLVDNMASKCSDGYRKRDTFSSTSTEFWARQNAWITTETLIAY